MKIAYNISQEQLPADSIVLTPDPWEFAFHTRIPSVVLPSSNDEWVHKEIAERFNATHVVLFNNGRTESSQRWEVGDTPDFLVNVYESPDIKIWRFEAE